MVLPQLPPAKSPVGMGELEKTTNTSKENVTRLVLEGYEFVINSIKNRAIKNERECKTFRKLRYDKGYGTC